MNLQENIRRILREEDRYDDKVGKTFWFEYHCYESPESCDAEIWYRSHQKVKVIGVSEWSYDDKEWRQEDGNPRVYLVEWEDGFQYDVFEDELMESPNEFYRPSPPKRNIQESIRKVLREETITKTFQDIVDKTLNEIKNICGDEDDDTFPDWLSDDDCDVANSIDKITILNVEKKTNFDRTTFFKVDVNIGFNNIFAWIDYDDLMYRIAKRIIGKWKILFIFNIKEQENSNKREMWESGKDKNINESTFFRRRIDLDEVKKLLPINSQQVFYETESYGQFKYELTLRVVEAIMWNKYKMDWEDLPEQEEIEFVEEVSDMFNDIIIHLYKINRGKL